MTKSIVLIAVIAAVMISSALAVTVTTDQAFGHGGTGGKGGNAKLVNDGSDGANGGHGAHDPCDNAGPAEHNPHCQ